MKQKLKMFVVVYLSKKIIKILFIFLLPANINFAVWSASNQAQFLFICGLFNDTESSSTKL
jgi:hypothetical protein